MSEIVANIFFSRNVIEKNRLRQNRLSDQFSKFIYFAKSQFITAKITSGRVSTWLYGKSKWKDSEVIIVNEYNHYYL